MKKIFQTFKTNSRNFQIISMIIIILFSVIALYRLSVTNDKAEDYHEESISLQTTTSNETTTETSKTTVITSHTTFKKTETSSESETTHTETITETILTEETDIIIEETFNDDIEITSEEQYPNEKTYLGTFKITHYCPCSYCCGEYTGITASGAIAVSGHTIGMSESYAFGTKIEINGNIYTVEDRGGFAENTIDIFCDTHEEALENGCYYADVYMVN